MKAFLTAVATAVTAVAVTASTASMIPGSGLFVFDKADTGKDTQQLMLLADAAAGVAPEIYVDPNDWPGVVRVAGDLAADFGRVLAGNSNSSRPLNGTVVAAGWDSVVQSKKGSRKGKRDGRETARPVIVLGTLGRSTLIDGLVRAGRLDAVVSSPALAGQWETYAYQVVDRPWDGLDAALVLVGSDRRASVFAAYGVSEQIGVSPWYWWADVPPMQRTRVQVKRARDGRDVTREAAASGASVFGPPSVRFRGIFFNDEAPALTGWARTRFTRSQYGSAFVGDFYRRVFELVMRLRGNYVWPAMWSSMFYLDDAANGPTADLYGVFMGTSHHEPMARADKEQGRYLRGSWDWRSNKAGVQAFMREGVERARNWSTIYTLGMRGSGDAASATLTASALEEVIRWQQATLAEIAGTEKDGQPLPQQWVMYKEVPGYWQNGMRVSDDVTLLWSDDNRGNIRRVPLANETARRGGSGIYYHFDYVGDPRNYKWINTIQLQKTWEQMTLAYRRGIQNIWIVNVGDLKGLELPTAHYMALAWNIDSFQDPGSTRQWLTEWCARQFGEVAAENASAIMTTYGMLVARQKFEDMSRTPFAFSATHYDEAEKNYAEWVRLAEQAQAVYDRLDAPSTGTAQVAFFEVVLHPVLAGKTVVEIYTKAALSSRYASQRRASTNELASDMQAAFATDRALKQRYHTLLDGKWNHIMDQTHLGYNNWQEPAQDSIPRATYLGSRGTGSTVGVAVQGSSSSGSSGGRLTLPETTPYTATGSQRWIDVFLYNNGTAAYQISSNASHVTVASAKGTLQSPRRAGEESSDVRALITVDWTAAPSGSSTATLSVTSDSTAVATVLLPLNKPADVPADFHGHVEADGVVSIEAAHFDEASSVSTAAAGTGKNGSFYWVVPDYGRTLAGVRLDPLAPSQTAGRGGAPVLVYPFYTFSAAAAPELTVYLSPSENANPAQPNRYAFSVDGDGGDGDSLTIVQPVPLANAGTEPPGWSAGVIAGAYVKKSRLGRLVAGRHVLRVWLLEPTMVLTKVVLDVGGLQESLLGPPESRMV